MTVLNLSRNPLFIFAALLGIGLLAGCGLQKLDNAQFSLALSGYSQGGTATLSERIAAFRASVHPLVLAQCAGCHGLTQVPKFAVFDANNAYSIARGLVNFQDPRASRLVQRAGDCHAGGVTCTMLDAMAIQVARWAEVELRNDPDPNGDDSTPAYVTTNLAVPTLTSTYQPLSWNLPGGLVFEVEIRRFVSPSPSGPGAYQFRQPKLTTTANSAIHLARVRILLNGTWDPSWDQYTRVDMTVAAGTSQIVSTELIIMAHEGSGAGDQIQVSFGTLGAP